MAKNNHFNDNRKQLDNLLRLAPLPTDYDLMPELTGYAHTLARLENSVTVICGVGKAGLWPEASALSSDWTDMTGKIQFGKNAFSNSCLPKRENLNLSQN